MTTFTIKEDDLSGQEIQALLEFHLREMHKNSPPGSVFALDLSGLRAPGVTVWSVWNGGAIAAIGALKELCPTTAEVKSMRTHPDHLRQGAAAHLLTNIVETARARGYRRLSLETGSGPPSHRPWRCTAPMVSPPAAPSAIISPTRSASSFIEISSHDDVPRARRVSARLPGTHRRHRRRPG